jgi:predicted Fe-S protein YdhL (DUF1289 family)
MTNPKRFTNPDDLVNLTELFVWESLTSEAKIEVLKRLLEDVIHEVARLRNEKA